MPINYELNETRINASLWSWINLHSWNQLKKLTGFVWFFSTRENVIVQCQLINKNNNILCTMIQYNMST